ncbi:GPMC system transcriptional regulator [uncultured Desulfuromonas sp.]|uniref:GPMC system transcriptional regulator n=1 Tax=uncultured Desulfuromonas sp. TaxID=181013 RepID=UPI002628B138|nr:GPMC system transcriptional regulator [uncultured Desulfuromonas sp.]
MEKTIEASLSRLVGKIRSYGKENLEDILHVLVDAVNLITRRNRCRVYLEDLTSGSLSCAAASGLLADAIREQSFPINTTEFLVSRVYVNQEEAQVDDVISFSSPFARDLAERFAIRASYHLPLLRRGRAMGVLCVDSGRKGQLPSGEQVDVLKSFLKEVAPHIDQARKYHQQIVLARRVDEAKKKEAALYMVKSAVRLIDKVTLASVLIPSPLAPGAGEEGLQILASYSEEKEARRLYEGQKLIHLEPGSSLLSRYINSAGVIVDETLLSPLYISNLPGENLQKRYITETLGLRSLYVVPRYEPRTRRVICLVNYYTRGAYRFSDFEKGLLEAHAEMAERVIQEIGGEHVEIQVLAEISDLLQEKFEGLQPFLGRILSKATELIGADTGSIALVQERDGERWLVVEDAEGQLVGAKSKEWLKRNIPPIRIGGEELPAKERSLTGYAAHTRRPAMISDTAGEKGAGGFYREITEVVKGELAIPVVCDEEVIAVICLDSLRPHFFTDEHKRILQIIERMISRHLSDLQRIEKLTGEVNRLRSDVGYKDPKISSYKLGNIIGNSTKASEVVEFIQRICPPIFNRIALWSHVGSQETTVGMPSILITGDTGSGKEFLFNNIFSRLNEMYRVKVNPRGELPVKKTNIAAYSGELTYSELFGHKRGAFTGAHTDRKGILEEAHGGVVFLDEIGDADPKTQVQLLRFLDNGGFVRLGENVTRYARVLVIAATNKDLRQLIAEGRFREDLYHRLSELHVEVPSLNHRREDIPDLAVHFLGKLYQIYKTPEEQDEAPVLSREAQALLARHHYTGNIRELRSILLRALFFRKGRVISEEDIADTFGEQDAQPREGAAERLTDQVAEEIFRAIQAGEGDFWSGVHAPYSESRISRDVVAAVVELARAHGASTMPRIASLLGACDPKSADPLERKTFYKFKNFLYKTIKIG